MRRCVTEVMVFGRVLWLCLEEGMEHVCVRWMISTYGNAAHMPQNDCDGADGGDVLYSMGCVEVFNNMAKRIWDQVRGVDRRYECGCDWGGEVFEVQAQGGRVSEHGRKDGHGPLFGFVMVRGDGRHFGLSRK